MKKAKDTFFFSKTYRAGDSVPDEVVSRMSKEHQALYIEGIEPEPVKAKEPVADEVKPVKKK